MKMFFFFLLKSGSLTKRMQQLPIVGTGFFFYVEKCARVHFLGQPVNISCAHSADIVSHMECHLVAANPGALLASRLLGLSYPRVRVA